MFQININFKNGYPMLYLKDYEADFYTEVDFLENSYIQVDSDKIIFGCNPWYEKINTLLLSINSPSERFPSDLIYFGEFTLETPSKFIAIQDEQLDPLNVLTYMKLPCEKKVKIQIFTNNPESITHIGLKIITGNNNE